MASSIFRVSRTETEGQQSGPATLNKAQEPVKMRVYEDESDVDLSEIGDKEIFAVEEENDLANVYVTDLVQEGNMNPITSNAVARFTGANYSTSEVKTSNTWIDGKPIYRRVLICTQNTTLSSAASAFVSVPGWKIPDTEPSFTANFTNVFGCINYWGRVDWLKSGDRDLTFYCIVSAITVTAGSCLIVEYTKSTD